MHAPAPGTPRVIFLRALISPELVLRDRIELSTLLSVARQSRTRSAYRSPNWQASRHTGSSCLWDNEVLMSWYAANDGSIQSKAPCTSCCTRMA
jgi:hypothetical protein